MSVGPRAADQRERGGQDVEVGPAHLHAALAVVGEPGSPGQDPGVVENEAVPRAEPEGQRLVLPAGHLGEGPVGGVEAHRLAGRQPQRLHVAVVEPDLPDPAALIDTDHRPGGAELGPGAGVGVRHLAAGQHLERGRILGAQQRGRVEAVHEDGLAALGGVVQAMHDLQRRHRIPERLGGARRQRPARVRLAARPGAGVYVDERPARGRPHQADALGHAQDRSRLARDIAEHDEAVTHHRGQARLLVGCLGAEERPGPLRESPHDVVRRPQPLGVFGACILAAQCAGPRPVSGYAAALVVLHRELAQPGDIKGGAVAVRAEHDLDPVTHLPRRDHRGVIRHIGDAGQPLAGTRIPAHRARAVDAQPDRGQPEQQPICSGRRPGVDGIPTTLRWLVGLACHVTPRPPG